MDEKLVKWLKSDSIIKELQRPFSLDEWISDMGKSIQIFNSQEKTTRIQIRFGITKKSWDIYEKRCKYYNEKNNENLTVIEFIMKILEKEQDGFVKNFKRSGYV